MSTFALAFPILFIFHDLEEIVGMRIFLDRNAEMLQKRFPKIFRFLPNTSTSGFALAVMEEFVVFTLIALAAIYFDNDLCWNIWFGSSFGITAHFVMHLGQSAVIRKYIPAVITSIICLPIGVLVLYHCYPLIHFNIWFSLLGLAIAAANLFLALKLPAKFSEYFK